MKFKRIFVFTILAFLTASCDGVFEKKSNQIFSLKEIQSNIANFLEDYAASGQGATPKKRILNSPMLNTPNKESSTSNEGSFTITVNTSYKNPYEFVDKNQVYDFGDAFALCEILKLLGIEDFNGEVFRLIDGNGFDSFYDITSFEGIEDAIEVNSVFYSLSFDDYFILNTFDNFVGFRDKNISIDCTGDFTSEGDLNKLYDEAVKLGNKHFTKEYIEASFQASRSRSKKF